MILPLISSTDSVHSPNMLLQKAQLTVVDDDGSVTATKALNNFTYVVKLQSKVMSTENFGKS